MNKQKIYNALWIIIPLFCAMPWKIYHHFSLLMEELIHRCKQEENQAMNYKALTFPKPIIKRENQHACKKSDDITYHPIMIIQMLEKHKREDQDAKV